MFLVIGVFLTVCGAIFASVPDVGTVNNECIRYYVPIKLAKLNTDGDFDLQLAFELKTSNGSRQFQINLRPVAGVVSSSTNISTISMDKGRNNFGVQVHFDNWRRYEGRLMDDPRSLVSGHVIDGLFSGFVNTIDDTYYLDPASDYFEGCMSQKFNTIVYKSGDVGHANETRCVERSGLVRRAHSLPAGFHQNLVKKSHRLRRANRQTTSTSFLCDLRVICDFRWYRHVAFRNATYGSELVVSLLRRVDQIFRALDFDGDGRSENVGFFLRYLDIYIDPVLPGYEDIEDYHAIRFFNEFRAYDFTGVCAGLLFTYRRLAFGNSQYDMPTIPITNIASLEQGICSKYIPPDGPFELLTDYGDYVSNALPVNFMSRNRVASAPAILVETAHQLGHLFGARDDSDTEDALCQPIWDGSLNYIMSYPNLEAKAGRNFRWSPCSRKAFETFLRGLQEQGRSCLKLCFGPSCLRDRWKAVSGSDGRNSPRLRVRAGLDSRTTTKKSIVDRPKYRDVEDADSEDEDDEDPNAEIPTDESTTKATKVRPKPTTEVTDDDETTEDEKSTTEVTDEDEKSTTEVIDEDETTTLKSTKRPTTDADEDDKATTIKSIKKTTTEADEDDELTTTKRRPKTTTTEADEEEELTTTKRSTKPTTEEEFEDEKPMTEDDYKYMGPTTTSTTPVPWWIVPITSPIITQPTSPRTTSESTGGGDTEDYDADTSRPIVQSGFYLLVNIAVSIAVATFVL